MFRACAPEGGTLDKLTAARAETGMRLIERGQHVLGEPDHELLSNLYEKLKVIHSQAYDWDAPDINREIGQGPRRAIRIPSSVGGLTSGTCAGYTPNRNQKLR